MIDIPLPSALLPTVVKLWEDIEDLYSVLSNESPPQNASNQFHQKAKQWVQLFLSIKEEGHQKKYVTPYMHAMLLPSSVSLKSNEHVSYSYKLWKTMTFTKEYQLMWSGQDNRGSKGDHLQDLIQRIPQ
ncbi:hypothetical protein EMCRGX_G000997 [Ephydatia muelleri]